MVYHEYEIDLKPGSKLFVYTDGITEAQDVNAELYGMDRTVQTVNQVKDGKPEQVVNDVQRILEEYIGEGEQYDDMTMLCLEYIGI